MANSRLCSIPDCGKPACNGRGWCSAHYTRWVRHGSTDIFKKASNGSAQRYLDNVVLRHGDRDECLLWPFARNKEGYGIVNRRRSHIASRVVCEAMNGAPPTPQHYAAHECGNGHLGCVNPHHLSWKMPADNKADELAHGTRNRGMRNGQVRLSPAQVLQIRRMIGTMTQAKIAAVFGVSETLVRAIRHRKAWAWLD